MLPIPLWRCTFRCRLLICALTSDDGDVACSVAGFVAPQRITHLVTRSRTVGGIVQTVTVTEPEQSANGWPPIDPSDGWAQILTDLQRDLQQIDPDHVVRQVKQKFGVLRVYVTSSDPALAAAVTERIRDAETESARTCEKCGRPGQLHQRDSGWYRTVCDLHAQPPHRWPTCPWPGWALLYARLIAALVRIDEDLIVEGVEVWDGELHVEVRASDEVRMTAVMRLIAGAEDESLMTCVVCGADTDVPHEPVPPLCEEHR